MKALIETYIKMAGNAIAKDNPSQYLRILADEYPQWESNYYEPLNELRQLKTQAEISKQTESREQYVQKLEKYMTQFDILLTKYKYENDLKFDLSESTETPSNDGNWLINSIMMESVALNLEVIIEHKQEFQNVNDIMNKIVYSYNIDGTSHRIINLFNELLYQ